MAFGDRAIEYTSRKIAGMHALLENWAGQLEGYAKEHASWMDQTGHARQGLHAGVEAQDDEFILYLSHGIEYGSLLETGTEPHEIKPREKKFLYWRGAMHPVKQVHHPGTRAYAIIVPTLDAHLGRIKNTVLDYWSD
jgi:hypothetical protein